MRLTGSGVLRPVGVPKMPPGLVELMEGLTRDVLKHNPPDVYEFCANHMRKLLEIRDGKAPGQMLTLEQKIAKAQQKVRQRAEERRQKYDKEMKLLYMEREQTNVQHTENDIENISDNQPVSIENAKIAVQEIDNSAETATDNGLKAPIHHEKDLVDSLEVEVFHKAANVVQNLENNEAFENNTSLEEIVDASDKLKENIHDDTNSEVSCAESKSDDIHLNICENEILENEAANNVENISSDTNGMGTDKSNANDYVEVFDNVEQGSRDHIRKPRSVDVADDDFKDKVNSVEKSYENIVSAPEEIANDLKEGFEEKVSCIPDVIDVESGEILENSEETANDILETNDTVAGNITKISEENLDGNIKEYIDEKVNAVENIENIVESADSAKVSENSVVKDLEESLDDDLTDTVEENAKDTIDNMEKIANITDEIPKNMLKVSEDTSNNIAETIDEKIDKVVNDSAEILDNIVEASDTIANDVLDGSMEKVNEIADTAYMEGLERSGEINTLGDVKKTIHNIANTSEGNFEAIVDTVNNKVNEVQAESEIEIENNIDTPKEILAISNTIEESDTQTDSKKHVENIVDANEKNIDKLDGTEKIVAIVNTAIENAENKPVATDEINDKVDENHCSSAGSITDVPKIDDESIDINVLPIDEQKNDEDLDIISTHENNNENTYAENNKYVIETVPEIDKTSSSVLEKGASVTTDNINDAKSIPVEFITELSSENVDKVVVTENRDNEKDTLLESPILENIEGVIKSEITDKPEIVLIDSSFEHGRTKRNLENISEAQEISEPGQPDTETMSIIKSSSTGSTIGDSNDSILELDAIKSSDESTQGNGTNHSNMDLETAAVTIQKVFRTFLFKSRNSTFDDTGNDDSNLTDEDNDKEEVEYPVPSANLNKERRTLGISRMDTVLQTVNEEKSLSLSTDDSSTLSSAATVIQAHVRGFLVRNRLNSNKTASSNSLVNSDGPSTTSLEAENDQRQPNKTVLNIHIVQGDHFLSRDESVITSMDLSLDGSPPSSTNLHPLGYDKSEPRKQLKREDAIQSVSPPSNNSGKLSEDVDSMKEVLNNTTSEQHDDSNLINELQHDVNVDVNRDSTLTKSATIETAVETQKSSKASISPEPGKESETEEKRKGILSKMSSDESDVITPFAGSGLQHSGEFHDIVLPTKVSRSDTSVVREFKNVLVYFLLLNNS